MLAEWSAGRSGAWFTGWATVLSNLQVHADDVSGEGIGQEGHGAGDLLQPAHTPRGDLPLTKVIDQGRWRDKHALGSAYKISAGLPEPKRSVALVTGVRMIKGRMLITLFRLYADTFLRTLQMKGIASHSTSREGAHPEALGAGAGPPDQAHRSWGEASACGISIVGRGGANAGRAARSAGVLRAPPDLYILTQSVRA